MPADCLHESDRASIEIADRGFLPLRDGDFATFRDQARGELRARLDLLQTRPDAGDDAWVYRRGGVIRGIGALSQYTPWHWVLWSFPGELTMGDWKRVIRFTRLRVVRKMEEPGVLRISATARVDMPGASGLLAVLGFRLEGLMECYGPRGESHYLYAIAHRAAEA